LRMNINKIIWKRTTVALALLCVILLCTLIGVIAYYTSIISEGDSEIRALKTLLSDNKAASYTIWSEAGMYYVANANGTTTFSSANVDEVIEEATGALTDGRTYKERILLKGDFVISSPIIVESYTTLEFQGKVTVADNINISATVKSEGFESLQGTDSTGGVVDVEIAGLHLDGNKAKANCNTGIQLYGRRLILRDVTVCNCSGDGIWTEWSSDPTVNTPNDAMEGVFSNVRSCFNDGRGWRMLGPHDSCLNNILLYCNGLVGFASWGLQGGCQGVNLHAYGNSQAGFYIDSPSIFSNIYSESNRQSGVVVLAHDVSLDGTFYSNGWYGIEMGSADRSPAGCYVRGKTIDNAFAGLRLANGAINRYELQMWENTTVSGDLNVNDTYAIVNTRNGQKSQNSGTAIISAGTTNVTVPHWLISTPRIVTATGTNSETSCAFVSARDETTITISVTKPVTSDREVDWYAED